MDRLHTSSDRGHQLSQNAEYCTVFAARDAQLESEYLCTGITCAASFLQCQTTTPVLVKCATKAGVAYTVRPTEGASIAKYSHVHST